MIVNININSSFCFLLLRIFYCCYFLLIAYYSLSRCCIAMRSQERWQDSREWEDFNRTTDTSFVRRSAKLNLVIFYDFANSFFFVSLQKTNKLNWNYFTKEQIKSEVLGALDFMRFVYTIFGMSYKLELSTRPAKALGDTHLWWASKIFIY